MKILANDDRSEDNECDDGFQSRGEVVLLRLERYARLGKLVDGQCGYEDGANTHLERQGWVLNG